MLSRVFEVIFAFPALLIGIMAGQACTVAVFGELVRRARIVPADLVPVLHP